MVNDQDQDGPRFRWEDDVDIYIHNICLRGTATVPESTNQHYLSNGAIWHNLKGSNINVQAPFRRLVKTVFGFKLY